MPKSRFAFKYDCIKFAGAAIAISKPLVRRILSQRHVYSCISVFGTTELRRFGDLQIAQRRIAASCFVCECARAFSALARCPIFRHKPAMRESVILVENLVKRYGRTVAVDGIGFTVERGVTAALLGGNGAGKTTTLSILLGLLLPSSGTIRVFGEDVLRHRYRVLPRMNFSSPYVDLPHRLTVRQNLSIYARLYGLPRRAQVIARLARDLQIEPLLDRPAGKVSAGQKTRVALAKALLNEPELLLLDEPTASLDPDSGDWVRAYLEAYRARTGATILLASHNMAEVERLSSTVMMMKEGKIVDRGSPDDLILRYGRTNLEEVFLQIAREPRSLEPVS
jgi:ABC-2 type transport system ATP-binding protein